MSRSLVVGSGAMFGAYGAGVCAELGRQLGQNHFDSIYASSVGVYAATFLAAGQPQVIESTWREHVDGRKVINLLRIRKALKLHYLEEIFQDQRSLLDVEAVFRSRSRLTYVLTRLPEGDAVYQSPTRENIFRSMSASSALPIVHGAVRVGNERFIDGAFSDPLPVAVALNSGAKLVVVVINQSEFRVAEPFRILGYVYQVVTGFTASFAHNYEARVRETVRLLTDSRVVVISPSSPSPLCSGIDTDKSRLNATVDLGIADARRVLNTLG